MNFELVSEITNIETIATGSSMKEINRLKKSYGTGRWRKLKGIATICLLNGKIFKAEGHWYEAHELVKKK
jgi:hypothetical protein